MILYHYCSLDEFVDILDSKVLWLTDLTKSNDDEEVIRTFEVLWSRVRQRLLASDLESKTVQTEIEMLDNQFKLEIQINQPYGSCFCVNGDILQLWLEHGDQTKGVSLGFDIDWFQGLERQKPHPNVNLVQSIGYDSVIYDNEKAEDGFYNICYNAIKEFGLAAWIKNIRPTFKHYSAFIKNPTFFGEYEYRIVYYPFSLSEKEHDFTEGTLRLSGPKEEPIKHYCLPWTSKENNHALKQIILGCNSAMNLLELETRLSKAQITGTIQVFKSACSYRIR